MLGADALLLDHGEPRSIWLIPGHRPRPAYNRSPVMLIPRLSPVRGEGSVRTHHRATHAPMFGDFGSKPKALCLGLYLH